MQKKIRTTFWGSCLLAALIITSALNLFYKIEGSYAYSHGLLLDYLLIKNYLSDFIAWGLIGVGVWSGWKQMTFHRPLGIGLMILSLIQIWLNPHPSTIWFLAKIWQWSLVAVVLYIHPDWWQARLIKTSLTGVIMAETALALYQWGFQRSLLPYQFLGETNLHQSYGLATVSWWGTERVLPYGSTAHPNVLGGLLLGYLVWRLYLEPKQNHKSLLLLGGTALTGIILTQSASALMGFVFLVLYLSAISVAKKFKDLSVSKFISGTLVLMAGLVIVIPVATHLIWKNTDLQSTSLSRRALLNQAAIQIWLTKPLTGIGLNQFVTKADPFTRVSEIGRFSQPAHHIGLLWLAETGLIGLSYIFYCLWRGIKSLRLRKQLTALIPLVWLIPILAFDHYLLTLQTGQWLLVGSLVLSLGQYRRT